MPASTEGGRVRAVHDAVRVPGCAPPYDTAHLTLHYPAVAGAGDASVGFVAPRGAPLPVVLLAGNFGCGPGLYAWLAKRLAAAGCCVVSWAFVGRMFGGRPGLLTGVDLDAVTPTTFGSAVPSRLLPAVLDHLPRVADLGPALDLGRVVLGGHSAGGTLALLCASWLPGVRGAFSYGGHTRTQVPQGFGEDHYLPLGDGPPLLLLGGREDGVADAVARAQTGTVRPGHPMALTRERAVPPGRPCRLVLLDGANHYSMTEGYDGTVGRGFLEADASGDQPAVRQRIGVLVEDFVLATACDDAAALERLDLAGR
jgi:dienelactone hydrolase